MSAPTPDALAAAERLVRAQRNAIEHATLALWAAQSELLAALDAGAAAAAAMWRDVVAADLRSRDFAAVLYERAFDALAALRFAASPLRLVPRVDSDAPAGDLAGASLLVDIVRHHRDLVVRSLWASQGHLLAVLDAGDEAAAGRWRECAAVDLRDLARMTDAYDDALDARAPLLAAQWEAAS